MVEMKVEGLTLDPLTNMPIIILKDSTGQKALPIWVGIFEANAIALEIESITTICSGIRRFGAASLDLAYVAAGKLDGYWEKNLNLWDMAAGVLLVKEAGGTVTETSGHPWTLKSKEILASNSTLHEEIQLKLAI